MLHRIPADVLARLRARWAAIAQHQLFLADLELGMRSELTALGFDPDRVVLDLDIGIVEDKPDGPPVEQPA